MPPKILVSCPVRRGRQHRARDGAEGFRDGRRSQRCRGRRQPARHRIHDHAIRTFRCGTSSTRRCRSSSSCSCSAPATTMSISKPRGAPRCRSRTMAARTRSRCPSTRMMLMLTVCAQSGLAARQRVGRALARQRAGAAHVRAARQDARHHRLRHHRQEGRAAGAAVRHACAVFRHRAPVRGRGGRARRANSACCANCCAPPTSCRCTCR